MVDWNYDEKTKTLTISGTGEMENYWCNNKPWAELDIEKVIIENGVTSIGDYAFYGCRNLTSVTIPDSVTSIGRGAFSGCSGLISVTIPDSVTEDIGDSAFEDTPWLDAQLEKTPYVTVNNIIIASNPKTCEGDIVIPDGVTEIGYDAFSGCSGLTSVIIPDSVTSIGDGAFENCESLTSVTIPNSVTSIGWGAFEGCSSLTSITIPDSVTHIGGQAFSGTPWLDAQLEKTPYVTINNIIIASNPKTCEGDIVIPGGITSIGWGAFEGCSGLTSVTIPDSVTSIGSVAFYDCSNLLSVTIPDSVTSIGRGAFSGCSGLISVTIPDSVTEIVNSVFYGCSSLTSVTIPDSVVNITNNAFDRCYGLAELTLPNIAGCDHITFHYDEDEPFSKQIEMIENKDYTVKMKREVKYGLLWQLFKVKPKEEELTAFIKKNFSRMMHLAIDNNDTEAINKVCENEKLLTSKNIDDLIDYSIKNTQNGGSLEIQAVLMNYKNEHFGDKKKRLRL